MTARTATLTFALIAFAAGTAAAQSAKTGDTGKTSQAAAQSTSQPAAGFEIPPFPPNPRVDKAKREAELRRQELEEALVRAREEAAAAAMPQPEPEPPTAPAQKAPARPAPRPASPPASAHTSASAKYELFGGYSVLRDSTDDLNFPLGWVASVAHPLDDRIGLVGEVSGGYKSLDVQGVNLGRASVHTFTAGPQMSRTLSSGIAAWGHLQAGLAIMHGSAFGVSASSTGFALIPGGGVDVPVMPGFALRIGGEVTIVRDTDSWNGFRFVAGIVMNR